MDEVDHLVKLGQNRHGQHRPSNGPNRQRLADLIVRQRCWANFGGESCEARWDRRRSLSGTHGAQVFRNIRVTGISAILGLSWDATITRMSTPRHTQGLGRHGALLRVAVEARHTGGGGGQGMLRYGAVLAFEKEGHASSLNAGRCLPSSGQPESKSPKFVRKRGRSWPARGRNL